MINKDRARYSIYSCWLLLIGGVAELLRAVLFHLRAWLRVCFLTLSLSLTPAFVKKITVSLLYVPTRITSGLSSRYRVGKMVVVCGGKRTPFY